MDSATQMPSWYTNWKAAEEAKAAAKADACQKQVEAAGQAFLERLKRDLPPEIKATGQVFVTVDHRTASTVVELAPGIEIDIHSITTAEAGGYKHSYSLSDGQNRGDRWFPPVDLIPELAQWLDGRLAIQRKVQEEQAARERREERNAEAIRLRLAEREAVDAEFRPQYLALFYGAREVLPDFTHETPLLPASNAWITGEEWRERWENTMESLRDHISLAITQREGERKRQGRDAAFKRRWGWPEGETRFLYKLSFYSPAMGDAEIEPRYSTAEEPLPDGFWYVIDGDQERGIKAVGLSILVEEVVVDSLESLPDEVCVWDNLLKPGDYSEIFKRPSLVIARLLGLPREERTP